MLFSDNPHDRQIEKLMSQIPNFKPRGHGIYVYEEKEYSAENCTCRECTDRRKKRLNNMSASPCIEQRIRAGEIPLGEVIKETMMAVAHPAFQSRLKEYIYETEIMYMEFKNEKHQAVFTEAVQGMNQNDKALMSALYLLTADGRLWYDAMLYNHKQFNNPIWYAGGIYGWIGRTPLNNYSIKEMKRALDACERFKIKDILMTVWGNGGNECSRYSHLSALYHIIQYAKGNRDIEKIKKGFKRIVGADYDDFVALDLPNQPGSPELGMHNNNPSHYMLYSDYFVCHLDYTVKPGAGDEYRQYASTLYAAAKRTRKYKLIFVCEALTCDILYHKYELGVKTRTAYQAGDNETLLALAKENYTAIEKLIPKLIDAAREQWYSESKPYGFDLIERKLGGLLARTTSCKKRIIDYVNGKIDSIPELAEEILPYGKKEQSLVTLGDNIYSTSART